MNRASCNRQHRDRARRRVSVLPSHGSKVRCFAGDAYVDRWDNERLLRYRLVERHSCGQARLRQLRLPIFLARIG